MTEEIQYHMIEYCMFQSTCCLALSMNPDQHMEQLCPSDPSLARTGRGVGGLSPPALPSLTDSLVRQHRLLPLPEASFTLQHIYPTYTRLSFTTKPDGNMPQSCHYKHCKN